MGKKARRAKGQGAKRSRRQAAKDLPAARGDGPRGGAGASAAKLTFGAPSSRSITVDPSDLIGMLLPAVQNARATSSTRTGSITDGTSNTILG